MLRTLAAMLFMICMTVPVWAAEREPFNPDQPFEQALTTSLLRSLLNQALDRLEGHLEITGNVDPDDVKGDRRGHLRFKFYPEGKSKSDQHLTAEGWFHLSPDAGQHDWHFKFKLPEDQSRKSPL
jgi:hypothetical protein